MRSLNITLVFLISCFSAASQPVIEWQRTLGGYEAEIGSEVVQTSDGGYFIIGRSLSYDIKDSSNLSNITALYNHGYYDIYCIKLDKNGKTQWQRLIGGYGWDIGNRGFQTSDGGYIVAGCNGGIDGDAANVKNIFDFWIIKLDATGAIQWDKSYGGTNGDVVFTIIQTGDGGFVLTGFTYSFDGDVVGNHGADDAWVIKLNSLGDLEWQKCVGGGDHDYTTSVVELEDGSLVLGGSTNSTDGDVFGTHGWDDYWLIKLNKHGDFLWQRCYGGSQRNELTDIVRADDGGFILGGFSASTDGDVHSHILRYDFWVLKVNSVGDIVWEHSYGGEQNDGTQGGWVDYSKVSLDKTADGGYIVGGSTRSYAGDVSGNNGNNDYWIIKIDPDGKKQWQKCLGGTEDDYSTSVIQTADNGFLVLGYSYSNDRDVLVHYGPTGNGFSPGDCCSDIWVVKLSSYTGVDNGTETIPDHFIFPNPSDGNIQIDLSGFSKNAAGIQMEVADVSGKVVFATNYLSNGAGHEKIDLSFLASGVYSVKLFSREKILTQKLIISRER